MKPSKLLCILISLASLAGPVAAQSYQDNVLTVGGRDFFLEDMGEDDAARHSVFPLHYARALKPLLRSDPELRGYRLFIYKELLTEPYYLEPPDDDYLLVEAEDLMIEGFQVYNRGRGYFLRPIASDAQYGVLCRHIPQATTFSICSARIVYPLSEDATMSISAKHNNPGTLAEAAVNFEPVVRRALDIITCLDITEDLERAELSTQALWDKSQDPNGCK